MAEYKYHDQNEDVEKIMISEAELDDIVSRIASEIDADQAKSGKRLLLVGILKGSVVFMSELMKKIKTPLEIDFMRVSSYGAGTTSSGAIKIGLDLNRDDLADLDVIIVEDIVDSGRTLKLLTGYLEHKGAKSVRCATLLDKPSRRVVDYNADYIGRVIPDEFVVGYGLDFDERYRDLPFVGVLKPEIYANA